MPLDKGSDGLNAQRDSRSHPLRHTGQTASRSRCKDLQRLNVRSLPTLRALHHVELYCLAFLKALEAAGVDRRVMHKHILAVLAADKAKPLSIIEPLYCSLFHVVSFLRFQ